MNLKSSAWVRVLTLPSLYEQRGLGHIAQPHETPLLQLGETCLIYRKLDTEAHLGRTLQGCDIRPTGHLVKHLAHVTLCQYKPLCPCFHGLEGTHDQVLNVLPGT